MVIPAGNVSVSVCTTVAAAALGLLNVMVNALTAPLLMVAGAKSRAPLLKVATKRRQPGELRDSIGMKISLSPKQESGKVSVGPLKDKSKGKDSPGTWGMFVEFGSVHGAAQPFMRPGFDSASQAALEAFTEVIREGVETLDK